MDYRFDHSNSTVGDCLKNAFSARREWAICQSDCKGSSAGACGSAENLPSSRARFKQFCDSNVSAVRRLPRGTRHRRVGTGAWPALRHRPPAGVPNCPQPNCGRIRCRINAVGIGLRFMVDSRVPENSGEGCCAATRPSCTDSAHAHAMVLAICGDGAWAICGRWMSGRLMGISGVGIRIDSTNVRATRWRTGSRTPSSAADRYC